MKKILMFAVAFVAIASHAASINWEMAFGARTIKDSTGAKLNGTAYLVLATDVSGIEAAKSEDAATFINALTTKALDSATISAGKGSPLNGTATKGSLTAGTVYDYTFIIFDSALNEYYALEATKQNAAYDALSADAALQVPTKVSFSAAELGATSGTTANSYTYLSAVKAGGGDDPVTPDVPEPATGALALAGLALLFRRRRA